MMTFVVCAVIAGALFIVVHLASAALGAQLMGIGVTRVTFGMGPDVFRVGIVQVKLLPLSGNVKLKMSEEGCLAPPGPGTCFDTRPRWQRILLLVGSVCPVLLLSAATLGGAAAAGSFLRGYSQVVQGAIQPLSTGQQLLAGLQSKMAHVAPIALIAVFWCKLAALNLLPYFGSNGAQALVLGLTRDDDRSRWERAARPFLLVFGCVLLGGWLLALVVYLA